ncbi:MAG: hypothetical protein AAF927_31240 [Bacteroidota bacterium]
MKSQIFLIASLAFLVSLSSCDPFKPFYQDMEGVWEVSSITIGERISQAGAALPDTSFNSFGELDFAFCDKNAHETATCQYTMTLADGQMFELEYQIVDAEELELVLSSGGADVPEDKDLAAIYEMTLNENDMTLMSAPNSSPLLAPAFQGRAITITLNRK